MNSPLVSIIIPVYNRENLIEETLLSVVSQNYHNWECILVDDVSTDNTLSVIKKYSLLDKRIKYHIRNRNPKGGNTCRNIGIKMATGDYICFFDSDDIMHKDLMETRVNFLRNNEHLGFCACECNFTENSIVTRSSSLNLLEHNLANHLNEWGFMTPSFLITRKVLNKLGFWDENIFRLQDVDFFSRLFLNDIRGIWLSDKMYTIRVHNDNISSTWTTKVNHSILRVFFKLYKKSIYHNKLNDSLNNVIRDKISYLVCLQKLDFTLIFFFRNFLFFFILLPFDRFIAVLKSFLKNPMCYKK